MKPNPWTLIIQRHGESDEAWNKRLAAQTAIFRHACRPCPENYKRITRAYPHVDTGAVSVTVPQN